MTPTPANLTQELRNLLKTMWGIDAKVVKGEIISESEKELYNKHLLTMIGYYAQNTQYWTSREELKIKDLAKEMLLSKRNKEQ